MRKDQISLKKQFKDLNKQIDTLQHQLFMLNNALDFDTIIMDRKDEEIKDLEQEVLANRINHWRAIVGQPLLTK